MIKKTLETEGVDLRRVHILPVPDIYRNALWVKHVETITPPFDVVYANEPVTVRLFKESSYDVRGPEFYKRTSLFRRGDTKQDSKEWGLGESSA